MENKRKEEKLKKRIESLQKELDLLRVVIDGIPDPIYAKDLQGRYLMVNSTSASNIGKPVEDIIGRDDNGLISPDTVENIKKDDKRVVESGQVQTYEATFTTAGTNKIFLTTKVPYRDHQGNIIGLFGISRDITQLKLVEEKLRSEHSFRKAIEDALLIGINVTDLTGKLVYVNQYFCEVVGWTAEELLGTLPPRPYWPPEETENYRKMVQSLLLGKEPRDVSELSVCRKNGERVPVLLFNSPLVDGNGNKIGIVVSLVDISNRKKTEESLRQSEEKFRLLIENIKEVFWISSPDFKEFYYISPSCEKVWGKSMESLYGSPLAWMDSIHPEDRQRVIKEIEISLPNSEFLTEYRIVRPDGTISWIRSHGFPVKNRSEEAFRMVGISEDITEKQKMEEEIAKVQKLESLGLFAGGIAHDFNNILTGILGNISLAKTWMNPEDRAFQRLDEAEKASHRATELARQLLTFAKGGVPIKKTATILKVLENSVNFALRGSNILSEFSFQKDLLPVEIDEDQIGQVIQNLAINAQQAMPLGGTIQVRAKNRVIEENSVDGPPLRKGNYVEISIEDQGVGIPKELLSRIFDPYFTTKQKGSGLGLAISHSIIQKHDGIISVKSQVGVGTTFVIFLPASPFPAVSQEEPKEELVKGKERVLVMDDEESILNIAGEMLRHLGYEVETALSGTKVLEKYKKAKDSGHPFDVVITDLTVPGDIGGIEVLERLKRIDSQVKVIVSSGYSNEPAVANFKSYGFSGFIPKPYRLIDMSNILQKIADKGRT